MVRGMDRVLTGTGLTLALAFMAAPTAAQDYRFAAGWNAGGAWFSSFNAGAGGGADDLSFDPGWIAGLQFEQYFGGGRIGLRANGALSERPLEVPGDKRDIGLWMVDADILLRLLPATSDRTVNAFLSAGAGLVKYNLGGPGIVLWESAGASFDGDDGAQFAVTGGFGIDIVTSLRWDGAPIGIRIEAVDHFLLDSPFAPLDGGDFDPVHNVRFVIGAFTGFGVLQ